MIGLYVGSALFGTIVIGVSLAAGGHGDDADGDGSVDHDHDHDHDVIEPVHGAPDTAHDVGRAVEAVKGAGHDAQWLWMPFLSLRFWTFFLASMGLTGTLLTLTGFAEPLIGLVSIPFGVAVGWSTTQLFRKMRTDQVTATTSLSSYAGLEAKVMVPVRPGEAGKIAVKTMAGRIEMLAKSGDGKVLEAGTTVLITSVVEGVADVTDIDPPHLAHKESTST